MPVDQKKKQRGQRKKGQGPVPKQRVLLERAVKFEKKWFHFLESVREMWAECRTYFSCGFTMAIKAPKKITRKKREL